MNIFKKIVQTEPEMSIIELPAPAGNVIITLYHEVDREIMRDLSPHIKLVEQRLQDRFIWKHYCYQEYKHDDKQEEFIADMEQALLFLPCTSAPFCQRFLTACQRDEHMREILGRIYMQPIPLRATIGVHQQMLPMPLAAYERGNSRDQACMHVAGSIEKKLLSYLEPERFTMPILLEERVSRYMINNHR
jgi:hypothetical protein